MSRRILQNRNGLEPGEEGHLVGRDPRRMTQIQLKLAGHFPQSPLAAIRQNCLSCAAGSPLEVRLCTVTTCACWPFRMGTNPWAPGPSMAQRRQRMAALEIAAAQKNARAPGQKISETGPDGPELPPTLSCEKSTPKTTASLAHR